MNYHTSSGQYLKFSHSGKYMDLKQPVSKFVKMHIRILIIRFSNKNLNKIYLGMKRYNATFSSKRGLTILLVWKPRREHSTSDPNRFFIEMWSLLQTLLFVPFIYVFIIENIKHIWTLYGVNVRRPYDIFQSPKVIISWDNIKSE